MKEQAIKLLDKTDAIVNFTKAVNTLVFHKNKFVEGRNTDVIGFKKSLLESSKSKTKEKCVWKQKIYNKNQNINWKREMNKMA